MNKSSFAKYLDKINNNQPINIDLFLKAAEHYSLTETQLLKILNWKKIKAKIYSVLVLNDKAFNELMQQYPLSPIANRIDASIAGNSHSKAVSGSMISLLAHQTYFPQLVIFSSNGNYQTPATLHKNLLIIENLENFLSLIQQTDKLSIWLDKEWPCDIVYAQGNAISNQIHQKFFSQYDKIRCLLDIDLGGLDIFKNINNLASSSHCEFVFSHYYFEKYIQYGNPLTQQQRLKIQQGDYPKALEQIRKTILKYNQFAEQEILLCH